MAFLGHGSVYWFSVIAMAGTITSLQYQKHNPERVNVYLDGRFVFGIAAIVAAHLREGQVLTDDDIARLRGRDEDEKAYERALNFLSYRPRSEAEVRRNLRKGGLPEETIDATVARLVRAELLDDAEFARYWVDNRLRFNPRGARALRHELRQRGVRDEAIARALSDLDEEAAARLAASSASRRYEQLPPREFARRMAAFLARRGFSYEVTGPLIDELLEAVEGEVSSSGELESSDGRVGPAGRSADEVLSNVESEELGDG